MDGVGEGERRTYNNKVVNVCLLFLENMTLLASSIHGH